MPRPAYPRAKSDRRRVLDLLANSPNGCTEASLLAHGFTIPVIVSLIRAGLAAAYTERVVASGQRVEVVYVKITEAGRRALA
jgi:hypothetical protein